MLLALCSPVRARTCSLKFSSSSPFEAFEAFVLTFEAFEAFVLTLRSLPPFSAPPLPPSSTLHLRRLRRLRSPLRRRVLGCSPREVVLVVEFVRGFRTPRRLPASSPAPLRRRTPHGQSFLCLFFLLFLRKNPPCVASSSFVAGTDHWQSLSLLSTSFL